MSLLDKGFTLPCGGFAQAGKSISLYIANREDIVSITKSSPTGKYDTIAMAAGKVFYKFDFAKDTANFTQTTEITDAGTMCKQTLMFDVSNCNDKQVKKIEEFTFAKIIAIFETKENVRVILGLDCPYGLEFKELTNNNYIFSTCVKEAAPELDNNVEIPI